MNSRENMGSGSFELWLLDRTGGVGQFLGSVNEDQGVEVAELVKGWQAHGRSQAVYVEDIYDVAAYQPPKGELPVIPGHVFASAKAASKHLGKQDRAVANALLYVEKVKRDRFDIPPTSVSGMAGQYPAGTAMVQGLALRWVSDLRD